MHRGNRRKAQQERNRVPRSRIVLDPVPRAPSKIQLKTTIPPALKREIAMLAIERGEPLCCLIETALRAQVERLRAEES